MGAYDTVIGRIGYEVYFNGRDALMGMKRMQTSFGTLKKVIGTVIAGKMVRDVALFGKNFSIMAQKTGQSIENLSKLRSSFVAAGVGAQGFERVVNEINDGLLGLSMGRGEWASKLAQFNISPYKMGEDGFMTMKTIEDIMPDLADYAKSMIDMGVMTEQDVLYRFRTLLNIPDEIGRKLLNGAEEYEKYVTEKAQKIGTVTDEEVKNLDALNEKVNEFGESVSVAQKKIGSYVSGPIGFALDTMTDVARKSGENPALTLATIGGGLLAKSAALNQLAVGMGGYAELAKHPIQAAVTGTGSMLLGGTLALIIADSIKEGFELITKGESDGIITNAWKNHPLMMLMEKELDIMADLWYGFTSESEEYREESMARLKDRFSMSSLTSLVPPGFLDIAKNVIETSRNQTAESPVVNQDISITVNGDMTSDVADEVSEKFEDAATGDIIYVFSKVAKDGSN